MYKTCPDYDCNIIGTRHCAKDKQHDGLGYSFGAPHAPF